ncbi:S-adenosyl-L-methionine-dependent methyltransferase [Mycena floridula]|nr:S-adenosyl-L-methionine-dependent methyltransferase [Mycena floridula]
MPPGHELKWLRQAAKSPSMLREFIRRRRSQEPLQYILGSQPFGSLNIIVRPPVLIPRPETEDWTIRLGHQLASMQRPLKLIDLGTGSGCIPLLLCHMLAPKTLSATGVDISVDAVALAKENALACHASHPTENTFTAVIQDFLNPDALAASTVIEPPFDVLTSNPPYISWHEYLELPEEVSGHEDPRALFGGPDGLDFYRSIAHSIVREGFLASDATIALEVGHEQADAVSEILHTIARVQSLEVWYDPWGKPRTVVAKK